MTYSGNSLVNTLGWIVLFATLFAATGCGSMRKATDVAQVNPIVPDVTGEDELLTVECWVGLASGEQSCKGPELSGQAKVCGGYKAGDEASRKECRNYVQDQLIIHSDRVCERHMAAIYGNAAVINTYLGFTTLVLAGIAAVTPGAAASSWAAGAALASGTRELINSEIYQGKLVGAIITEIESNRETARSALATHYDAGVSEYTPAAAIRDALQYHDDCSFYAGVSSLVSKAGQTERYSAEWAAESTREIRDQLNNDNKELAALEGKLTANKDDTALQDQLSEWNDRAHDLRQRIARNEGVLEYMSTLVSASSYRGRKPSAVPAPAGKDGAKGGGS